MNGVYTQAVSRLLFPLHEKLKKHHTVPLRQSLDKTQWLSPEQILEVQAENVKRFFADIATNVPWYREQYALSGLPVHNMTLSDLQKLPRLTKDDLRAHSEQFKTQLPHTLKPFNTGGSSGAPLTFFLGKRVSHDVAAKWRATRWWDVDIGDKELVLWGSPIEVNTQDRVKALRDIVLRTTLFPAFDLGESGIKAFIETYRQFQPRMLFGYPSAFARIASYAKHHNIHLLSPTLRVCFVTAERLYDEQRAIISEQFGVPVANGYGSRDAGFIAHECPHGGMHVMAEHIVVEILKEDGSACAVGETGEITITHLHTSDFPFVRYRTGDCAAWSNKPCACGRGLATLERIEGRVTDFVQAVDGTQMHGLALIYVVREHPEVTQFRIVQHTLTQTEVLLVAAPWTPDKTARIVQGMQQRLGQSVQISVRLCDHIPTEKNGKYRFVVSHVVRN